MEFLAIILGIICIPVVWRFLCWIFFKMFNISPFKIEYTLKNDIGNDNIVIVSVKNMGEKNIPPHRICLKYDNKEFDLGKIHFSLEKTIKDNKKPYGGAYHFDILKNPNSVNGLFNELSSFESEDFYFRPVIMIDNSWHGGNITQFQPLHHKQWNFMILHQTTDTVIYESKKIGEEFKKIMKIYSDGNRITPYLSTDGIVVGE